MKSVICLLFLICTLGYAKKPCGKVIFGDLDWDSSRFHVELASFILKHGLDCEVDKIPGTTMPLLAALGKGDIHVLMEVWKQNMVDAWREYEDRGDVVELGVNFPDAVQGWYVPTYLIKGDANRGIKPLAPNLKMAKQLPEYKKLFQDPEVPSKGRFFNCILGWSCEDVNTKKLKAYGLLEHFVNFKPGTGAALAAVIASKYQRGEPFVAYYWEPTWILGKYDLTMLQEDPYDAKVWDNLVNKEDYSKAVAYPVVKVVIGANTSWAQNNPAAADFLSRYRTNSKMASDALAYMEAKKGRTPKDAARNFLLENKELWSSWVDSEAQEKVVLALGIKSQEQDVWKFDLAKYVNLSVDWIVKEYSGVFRSISGPVLSFILLIEKGLKLLPWWAFTLVMMIIAFGVKGSSLSVVVLASFLIIKALGVWDLAMQTLALMLISTIISTLIGLPLGILSATYDRFRKVLLPILDAAQTMPSFVYLIPALMLFGLGKVPAIFATVIYAIVPTIRLTDLGIRRVDPFTVEAARSFGATKKQMLWKVKLPLALPTIMAGINQTTMLALSMVVIASMIGARGLGEMVLLGIQKLDVGQGLTAGIAIVLLAIVLDRITQAVGIKMDKTR